MKFTLKLLLLLGLLFTGIYAATPLWLSYILARQLPQGWQLEKLEAAYPGPSGIDISLLRIKGKFQAAEVALIASDLRFSFQELKTEVDSISLDIHLQAAIRRGIKAHFHETDMY